MARFKTCYTTLATYD